MNLNSYNQGRKECYICGSEFNTSHVLEDHIKSNHSFADLRATIKKRANVIRWIRVKEPGEMLDSMNKQYDINEKSLFFRPN